MTQIDLSQLGLTAGNHDIQVVAKATGYLDSEITPSGQIIYNPQPMPTTKAYLNNGWLGILVENGFDLTSVDSVRFTSNSSLISGLSKIADVGMTEDDNIECYFDNGELIVYSSDLIECFDHNGSYGLLYERLDGDTTLSLQHITEIHFDNFDTSETPRLFGMFRGCSNLTSLDLSNFDTRIVNDIRFMFDGCTSLQTIIFGENCTFENVTYPSGMFQNLTSLTSIDISMFDLGNATDLSFMFAGCNSLTSINISGLDTSNVEWINWAFAGVNASIVDMSSWDLSNLQGQQLPDGNQYAFPFGLDDAMILNILQGVAQPYVSTYQTAIQNDDLATKTQILTAVLTSFQVGEMAEQVYKTDIGEIRTPTLPADVTIFTPYGENGLNAHYEANGVDVHTLVGNAIITRK